MSPAYTEGDFVVTLRCSSLRPGDVVIVTHPRFRTIIKRVSAISPDGLVLLQGDNPASTSSTTIGWQPKARIIGKVIWHCRP